jgi:hypothetical protein
MELKWELDEKTAFVCRDYPIFLGDMPPAQQYPGHNCIVKNWQRRLLTKDDFKDNVISCSPSEIVRCFREQRYLAGLALVVSWGGMARTSKFIYDRHSLKKIENVLCECHQDIRETNRIDYAWRMLTEDLDWSAVISSKALHFICRSLGCETNPPVAIDNAIILKKVWPIFKNNITKSLHPQNWSGKTFGSYNRYMTAILVWASQRQWTTTQIENTIFTYFQEIP